MILKPSKKKSCSVPISKVVCGKPLSRLKTVLKKQNERLHNLETLKSIHTKFGALSQSSLLLNCGNISRLSRKHWGV